MDTGRKLLEQAREALYRIENWGGGVQPGERHTMRTVAAEARAAIDHHLKGEHEALQAAAQPVADDARRLAGDIQGGLGMSESARRLEDIAFRIEALATPPNGVPQAAVQPDRWTASHYSKKQAEWCRMYESETTFEPLMCDYEAGNESFVEAAKKSISWFESWSCDAHLRVGDHHIPGARRFA